MWTGLIRKRLLINLQGRSFRQRQARLHTVGLGLAKGQPMCGVGKGQGCLRCTPVTRFKINGGVGYSSCRTTQSCIFGPYHQGYGPDSIEKKDSQLARRADHSFQVPAASKAAHCRIRFGWRPAYVQSWPKAKLACAVPKSQELG